MLQREKKTRDQIQSEAIQSNIDNGGFSTLVMCTGAGKSKCAVDLAKLCVEGKSDARVFLVVPTQKLRDKNWIKEFENWKAIGIYENNLVRSCYSSLLNHKGKWDLVIFDEIHHLTERHIEFFEESEINSIVGLTATPPDDSLKMSIINAIAPISYVYTMEEGIYDGVISDCIINIIGVDLDEQFKIIPAGSKKRRFFQTERERNDYLDSRIEGLTQEISAKSNSLNDYFKELSKDKIDYDFVDSTKKEIEKLKKRKETLVFNRLHFIKQLTSKTIAARELFEYIYKKGKRYVIFCGSIKQANELSENRFHSEVKGDDYDRFVNGEIDVLAVVDSLNEGHNIPNLDEIIAAQVSSKELALIQRIGRVVRFREGHIAVVYILYAKKSVDEKWMKSAIESFEHITINFFDNIEQFKQECPN